MRTRLGSLDAELGSSSPCPVQSFSEVRIVLIFGQLSKGERQCVHSALGSRGEVEYRTPQIVEREFNSKSLLEGHHGFNRTKNQAISLVGPPCMRSTIIAKR